MVTKRQLGGSALKGQRMFHVEKRVCGKPQRPDFSVLQVPEEGSDGLLLPLTALKPGLLCLLVDPEEEAEAEVLQPAQALHGVG